MEGGCPGPHGYPLNLKVMERVKGEVVMGEDEVKKDKRNGMREQEVRGHLWIGTSQGQRGCEYNGC